MKSPLGSKVLLWMFVLVGAVPVGVALFRNQPWGWEPAVGLLLTMFGVFHLRKPEEK